MKSVPASPNQSQLDGKVILVGLTGSIAIYKSCELVRRLKEEGGDLFCLMSQGAQKFVTPLTFSALSENPVVTDLWDHTLWSMAHVKLAKKADLFIIAPASVNCLARLANGAADDAITTTACTVKSPILIAPAMHETMWLHPATQSNFRKLKSYGYHFIGPEFGPLAQGESGWGRFAEPQVIIKAAKKILAS